MLPEAAPPTLSRRIPHGTSQMTDVMISAEQSPATWHVLDATSSCCSCSGHVKACRTASTMSVSYDLHVQIPGPCPGPSTEPWLELHAAPTSRLA